MTGDPQGNVRPWPVSRLLQQEEGDEMAKIPTTIVTGFLGAGKTTLIRNLLQNAGGRRLAVIVNEFGDIGVDAEILRGCGIETCGDDDIIELANGCICCTVADDFLPTLQALIDRPNPPEHILIETSGLALPKPLIKAFTWPQVRTQVTVDGVVAVIDADAVHSGQFAAGEGQAQPDHDTPLEQLFEDQLACADLVILNKTDLLDGRSLAGVETALRKHLRPGVVIVRAQQGATNPAILLGVGAGAEDDLTTRPSHHDEGDHGHDDFETFAVTGGSSASLDQLTAGLSSVLKAHGILRLKGVVAISGSSARLIVQAVGPRLQTYFDRPWREGEVRASNLVIIGETGLDRAVIIHALLAALT
jgi:cobalamin biosynthesis protein CobW